MGAWAYPGTAHFFRVPLLSQERVKLRTLNQILHAHLWAQSEQKPIKISGKVAVEASSGTPENFQGTHTYGA